MDINYSEEFHAQQGSMGTVLDADKALLKKLYTAYCPSSNSNQLCAALRVVSIAFNLATKSMKEKDFAAMFAPIAKTKANSMYCGMCRYISYLKPSGERENLPEYFDFKSWDDKMKRRNKIYHLCDCLSLELIKANKVYGF